VLVAAQTKPLFAGPASGSANSGFLFPRGTEVFCLPGRKPQRVAGAAEPVCLKSGWLPECNFFAWLYSDSVGLKKPSDTRSQPIRRERQSFATSSCSPIVTAPAFSIHKHGFAKVTALEKTLDAVMSSNSEDQIFSAVERDIT